MAITYVDLTGAGSATSPYDTWAKATSLIQTGLTQAGAGGQCYVKDNAGATNPDTATTKTLTSPGTIGNPTNLIGVKSGTTNAPPVESDRCIRGTDNLPVYQASTGAMTLVGEMVTKGIRYDAGSDRLTRTGGDTIFYDCEIYVSAFVYLNSPLGYFEFVNCETNFAAISSYILLRLGAAIKYVGGVFTGSSPTRLIDNAPNGRFEFYGVDFSNLSASSTLIDDLSGSANCLIRFANCSLPASYVVGSGSLTNKGYVVEVIQSNNDSALGSGASIRDYKRHNYVGEVSHEFTAIRTGGADDGADGGFSVALTPNVDTSLEAAQGPETPWMSAWVAGDGTTAKTFTIFIANSGAADYNTDDVRLELLTPSSTGTADHDLSIDGDLVPGSTTAITDDAVSSWGTGAANAQKLSVTITPDFSGVAYARVIFMKRFAASPETLYVDPKLDVT